jgi:hypothetical protein
MKGGCTGRVAELVFCNVRIDNKAANDFRADLGLMRKQRRSVVTEARGRAVRRDERDRYRFGRVGLLVAYGNTSSRGAPAKRSSGSSWHRFRLW